MRDDLTHNIIVQADILSLEISQAQTLAAIKNAAIRHADRMAKYEAWVSPEEMKRRKEEHAAAAAKALEFAKIMSAEAREALGLPPEDPPLPPEAELPKHMRGQAESTIRAMLRQEKWQHDPLMGWARPKLPGITLKE